MKKPAANIKYRILSVLSVITVLFIWELVTDILHLISSYDASKSRKSAEHLYL